MSKREYKHERKRQHVVSLPPIVESSGDLDEAIRAREDAERALRRNQARRGRVDRVVRALREIRRTNHFAAALDQITRDTT